MNTRKVPFDIYLPATGHRPAVKVTTIEIDVVTDASGNERITPESSALIDKTQARYMGLLAGADITSLRKRLGLSQDGFSELIGCGKKSLSRWENGREFPSQLVNTLLRLLDEDRVSAEDLRAVRPCFSVPPAKSSALPPDAVPTAPSSFLRQPFTPPRRLGNLRPGTCLAQT